MRIIKIKSNCCLAPDTAATFRLQAKNGKENASIRDMSRTNRTEVLQCGLHTDFENISN